VFAANFQFASKVAGTQKYQNSSVDWPWARHRECALDVGGKSQSLFEQAGRGIEGDGAAGGPPEKAMTWSRCWRLLIRRQRVEEHFAEP